MQVLTDKKIISAELDMAISVAGKTVYFNNLYGTCNEIDPIYVLRLERARRMLSGVNPSADAIKYSKDLLTIKRNGQ